MLGHSRGTIVEVNALNILQAQGGLSVAGSSLDASMLSVVAKGPAVSSDALNKAYSVIIQNSDSKADYFAFPNDPVSTLIGRAINRNTGAALQEIPAMVSSSNSAHSCYGTGAEGCTQIEKPYSYQGLNLDQMQAKRQERVDALLRSGPFAKPEVAPMDPLNLGQQQIERYRLLQKAIPAPTNRSNSPSATHGTDPRIEQLEDLSTQLGKEHGL